MDLQLREALRKILLAILILLGAAAAKRVRRGKIRMARMEFNFLGLPQLAGS
jgi:hypothetical protein